MGMALAVTVLVGLMGSSLTWLWFRLSYDRPADPDFASLLKQRRPTFGEHIQSVDDSSH